MRAARIVTPLEGTPASQPAIPGAIPAEDAAVRIAVQDDAAADSPVHALQAELERAFDRKPRARQARWTFDPVRLVLFAYTVGFWWALFALGSAMMHGWAR